MIAAEQISEFYHLQTVLVQDDSKEKELKVPEPIGRLFQQYHEVFEEPKTLPPVRDIDHQIPLESGSKLVNIRPYM